MTRIRRVCAATPLAPGGVLAALILTTCVSAHNIADDRGRGETRCYRATYDDVWPAVEKGVKSVGLVLERANRENGILVARTYEEKEKDPEDMALQANAGERVAVFLERDSVDKSGADIWAVEVVSRPIFQLDPTPFDWTRTVFLAVEQLLPDSATAPSEDVAACNRVRG